MRARFQRRIRVLVKLDTQNVWNAFKNRVLEAYDGGRNYGGKWW